MASQQLIHQNGERLFVTSLDISNRFGKRHDDVLKAIRNLDCSEEFKRRNFAEISYNDGRNRPQRAYELTRDGFSFVCMGFTGPQVAPWKERYIQAFSEMEAALRASPPVVRQELALAREVGALRDTVAAQSEAIIGLYREVDSARRGHLGALTKLLRMQERQAKLVIMQEKREAKETILRLEAEGVPREIIAQRTGRTLNHIRQVIFQARHDGTLSPQGELPLGGA